MTYDASLLSGRNSIKYPFPHTKQLRFNLQTRFPFVPLSDEIVTPNSLSRCPSRLVCCNSHGAHDDSDQHNAPPRGPLPLAQACPMLLLAGARLRGHVSVVVKSFCVLDASIVEIARAADFPAPPPITIRMRTLQD